MARLTFKDCSPFKFDEKEERASQVKVLDKYLPKLLRKEHESQEEAKNDSFFVLSDRDYDTDDEAIVFFNVKDGQWWAGRYVGKCRIDGYDIEIRPRFGKDFLLSMLDDVYNLKFRESFQAAISEKDEWESIVKLALYAIWTGKFAQANKYGLPRKAVKREYIGYKIRGHLNVRKSIKTMHTIQQLVSEYRERDYDEAICKIVFHAYKIL